MNTKKKILFLVTQSEFGGAQRFIYTLIEGMRRYAQIKSRQNVGNTQIDADKGDFLYSDITYKIRGACFKIWKEFRGAFKEKIIERALAKELQNQGLRVDIQKQISVFYDSEKMGKYVPDMVVNDKVLIELKSKTFLTKEDEKQFWLYLKGSEYRLGLLINFGRKLEIKRKIYDTVRDEFQRKSAYPEGQNQRVSAIDYEVVVAAGPDGDDENGLLSLLEGKGINTRHLRYLKRSINPFFDFYLSLREAYKLIKQENPDILFLCSSKAGAVGSLAGRLAGIKRIIYRIGGWTFNDPWPRWKKKFYIKLEKWTAKFKDVIINNSEVDCKQAEELGIKPKEKILTIYNGLDFSKMNFLSREEARNLLSIQGTNLTVGGIINFYPVKGMKYLVEAAAFLINDYPELMFVIIGEGEERKKIENLIKKFNLKKNFYLTGTVSEAYKYLKMFDIFVLPSLKEGLPWTILESMAAEVPVVATKVGGVPEMIENGKTGFLVAPESAKELAEVIKKLLGDSDLREKIAEEAIKTLKEKFSLEQMLKQYEDLFFIN